MATVSIVNSTPDNLVSFLRGYDIRPTTGRIEVLRILISAGEPMSIEDILKSTNKIHMVTLYRILERFVREGIVYQTHFRSNKALFEYQNTHHHHLTCTACGYREIVEQCVASSAQKIKKTKSFPVLSGHILEYFGICRACTSQKH